MIAVIFELTPAPGRKQEYLDLAAALAPELERADGFISIERFESITAPGRFVSLSYWRDEEAVRKWRNLAGHRAAQAKGRGGIFSGYRLRVASVLRDSTDAERAPAPRDSVAFPG
ncbi:MAG: antibiotic biosynthesis monooxygenase, partial [Burkholderiales bacterium]